MKNLTGFINEAEKSKKQKEYQAFFDKKLKEYGVDSPAKLDDAEKKKFFNEIDKEWTGEATNEKKVEEDFDSEEDEDSEDLKDKKEESEAKDKGDDKGEEKEEEDEEEDDDEEEDGKEKEEDDEDEDEEEDKKKVDESLNEATSLDNKSVDKLVGELMKFKNTPGAFAQLVMDIAEKVYDKSNDSELVMAMADKVVRDMTQVSKEMGDM